MSDLDWEKEDEDKEDNIPELPSGIKPSRVVREKETEKDDKLQESLEQVKVRKTKVSEPGSGLFSVLFIYLYKNLYILGAMVIRRSRRLKRKLHLVISKIRGRVYSFMYSLTNIVKRAFKEFFRRAKQPFLRFSEEWRRGKRELIGAKGENRSAWSERWQLTKLFFGIVWRVLRTILNHAVPIAAAVVLFVVVRDTLAVTDGLKVVYKGVDVGYIKHESEFGEALEDVESRIITGTESSYTSAVPSFEVVRVADKDQFTPMNVLANNIITASSEEIQPAYAVYVNDTLLGAVEDGDPIYAELQGILDKNRTGKLKERVEFQKNVSYTDGIFPKSSIISEDEMLDLLASSETDDETYTVKDGESLVDISEKLGTALSNLVSINPDITDSEEEIEEGTKIYTRKGKPLLSVQNVYTDIYIREIDYQVKETADPLYAEGYYRVVSAGVPGTGRVTSEVTAIDGVKIGEIILDVEHLTDPITEQVTIGTNEGGDTSAGFMWPGAGGYISCYVGGYAGHAGIDIAGTGGVGTPVYASASGRVSKAAWSYVGYGNHIVIDHGDGWQTLYGHNSDLYVQVGDYVQKGKIIAAVGSTGWSSGPHIHFEVIQNGRKLNPVDFVGAR